MQAKRKSKSSVAELAAIGTKLFDEYDDGNRTSSVLSKDAMSLTMNL
jgi:hypothetical protein